MSEKTTPTSTSAADPTVYNRLMMLEFYTVWVIWICHPLAWRVSNRRLRRAYRALPNGAHLSVGPGNGHFLRYLPKRVHTLRLLDPNRVCLSLAANRRAVRRRGYRLFAHVHDALQPWQDLGESTVNSIDCQMMLHTLRRTSISDKASVIAEAARVLKPGGTFFGATILTSGAGVRVNAFARRLIATYTAKGWFSNAGDTADDLERELHAHFGEVTFEVHGCTAVWTAVKR